MEIWHHSARLISRLLRLTEPSKTTHSLFPFASMLLQRRVTNEFDRPQAYEGPASTPMTVTLVIRWHAAAWQARRLVQLASRPMVVIFSSGTNLGTSLCPISRWPRLPHRVSSLLKPGPFTVIKARALEGVVTFPHIQAHVIAAVTCKGCPGPLHDC